MELFELRPTGDVLPEAPAPALIPYLDAARRAIERHGWSRTTMRDIAREAGVERTTIYRHVGSIADVYRLLVAHELHRLIELLPGWIPAGADGPTVVVELLASAVEHCTAHPVISKLLADEPEVLSGFLQDGVPAVIDRITGHLAPMFDAAARAGVLAPCDSVAVSHWVARVGLSLLVAPPPGDLRAFLGAVLRPVFDPSHHPRQPEVHP